MYCDTPADLAISAFSTMDSFLPRSKVDFSIFTGDTVAHDSTYQVSRDLVQYQENVTYSTFKAWMGNSPVYVSLGNHNSLPDGFTTPNNMRSDNNIYSWDYQGVSKLWDDFDWIDDDAKRMLRSTTQHTLSLLSKV